MPQRELIDFLKNIQVDYGITDWHIPIANRPKTLTLSDEIFNDMIAQGKQIYKIDLSTRTINGPATIGVKMDHNAELFIFRVARYHDTMDLATANCIIQFKTIDKYGNSFVGLYPVMFYDITSAAKYEEILIPWNIPKSVTQSAVTIEYNFRFYKVEPVADSTDEFRLIYNLNTQSTTTQVLSTLNIDDIVLHSAYEDVVKAYQRDVSNYNYEAFLSVLKECYDKAGLFWENAENLLRLQGNT